MPEHLCKTESSFFPLPSLLPQSSLQHPGGPHDILGSSAVGPGSGLQQLCCSQMPAEKEDSWVVPVAMLDKVDDQAPLWGKERIMT